MNDARKQALEVVRSTLGESDLTWKEISEGVFTVDLPGEKKLSTPCRLDVGEHAFGVHAFVARQPDIYLDGRLPLVAVTPEEIDRLLGAVLSYSDGSFNTILELGFASSIRKEWEWRKSRGESTRNLEAFRGWLERDSG